MSTVTRRCLEPDLPRETDEADSCGAGGASLRFSPVLAGPAVLSRAELSPTPSLSLDCLQRDTLTVPSSACVAQNTLLRLAAVLHDGCLVHPVWLHFS